MLLAWNRTRDLGVTGALLYRLSYSSIKTTIASNTGEGTAPDPATAHHKLIASKLAYLTWRDEIKSVVCHGTVMLCKLLKPESLPVDWRHET